MKHANWKTLAVLAALTLIFVFAPALTGETAKAEDHIVESIEISNLLEPVIGEKPDTYYIYKAGVYVSDSQRNTDGWRRGVLWVDETTNTAMAATDTFTGGHTYSVKLEFFARNDYTFTDSAGKLVTTASVRGKQAEVILVNSQNVYVKFTFPTLTIHVDNVSFSDLDQPKVGKTPDYDVTFSATGCRMEDKTEGVWKNGIKWINTTDSVEMMPTDTFKEGKTYQVCFSLVLEDGYAFTNSVGGLGFHNSVNGGYGGDVKDLGTDKTNVGVFYQFPKLDLETIKKAAITDVEAPKMGAAPDYDVTVEGEYFKKDKTDNYWKNGVKWYDETTEQDMKPTDTFIGGHRYRVTVALSADTGYAFAYSSGSLAVTGTINNNRANAVLDGRTYVEYSYTFPKLDMEPIVSIVITDLDVPEIESTPDFEITLNGEGIQLENNPDEGWFNGVQWWDYSTGTFMTASDRFKPKGRYRVSFSLSPLEGYSFFTLTGISTVKTCTINEERVNAQKDGDRNITLKYDFSTLPGVINNASIYGVDEPVAGETPDFEFSWGGGWGVDREKADITWIDTATGSSLSETDTFEGGHVYKVRVTVYATDDAAFAKGLDGEATLFRFNEMLVTEFGKFTSASVEVEYTFPEVSEATVPAEPAVKIIDSVDIAITPPEAGQNPSFEVTLTGEGCHMSEDENEVWVHGVMYMDQTAYTTVTAADVFGEGETYEAHFSISADEGYSFFNDAHELVTTFTINGEAPWHVGDYDPYAPSRIHIQGLFATEGEAHLFPVDFAGFTEYGGGMFLVSGGDVVTEANGVVQDPDCPEVWYFCANGQVQLNYSGLAEYGGKWFFLSNGILNTSYTGVVNYDGARFIVAAGRLLDEYNGLIQDPNTGLWYYVAGGQVADYTGLVMYDGAWFYVIDGELATGYNGPVDYDGATFNVVGGQVVA